MASSTGLINVWTQQRGQDGQSAINRLWLRFSGMYPRKFLSLFKDQGQIENWKAVWADALASEGITPDEVAKALQLCLTRYDWPPELPEFMQLCRPPIEPEAAYYEAVRMLRYRFSANDEERALEKWSNPAIYFAANRIGTHDLRMIPFDKIIKRWRGELDDAVAKVRAGIYPATVPERKIELPPLAKKIDPAKAQENIERLRSILATGLKNVDAGISKS